MKIKKAPPQKTKIVMQTRAKEDETGKSILAEWWKAPNDARLAQELCGTAAYLKTNQTYRIRQLAVDVRLYSGLAVYSYAGSNVSRMDRTKTLPDDRPTFNLIQACTDTLVSRLGQSRPQPKFLCDGADYRQRHMAQQLNHFMLGEFYQTKAYDKSIKMLRDAIVMGTGCLKVYEGDENKVCVDRVMITDLYVDDNDCVDGDPQQMIQLKLMDRDKLLASSPRKAQNLIEGTPQSYPDNSPDSGRTTADQVMVVEGWKLPNGSKGQPGYVPGRHTIATVGGIILDEEWHKPKFPFVFLNYSDPFRGFFGQGLATQLFGTQMTLNRILYTIARSIMLNGVPRWLVEKSSGVVKAHIDNQLGTIVTYSHTKPECINTQCNAAELYTERDKLIQYGFQQCGVSAMQATSQKPEGLDSGAAIRSYDDISNDRFADLSKKYDNVFVDLAYLIAEQAKDIAEREGKYQTVYPNKDGTKEVDLPAMKFLQDPFVIQVFTESSLPRTPAGRIATITEMVQSGMLSLKEGRRLMHTPQDLEQNEKLDNASEERIFQILDNIVEDGKYTMPDMFLDLQLATQLTVQYINLYLAANLEEKKADMLRTFFNQVQTLMQAAIPPAPAMPAPMPTANPQPTPTSPLVPNAANQAA